jgi:long-chain acyl-CoA synthetase
VTFEGPVAGTIPLDELRARGRELDDSELEERIADIGPDDLATIVYTSGTTGPPKGCMITHANCMATVEMYEQQLEFSLGDETPVVYIFLPLAHSLARVTQYVTLDVGGTLAFWSGDPKRILEELRDVKPTHFPSVPRVFEKIYTAAMSGIAEQSLAKRAIMRWALAEGRRWRETEGRGATPSAFQRRRYDLADKLVLSKVRALFGGELKLGLTGAAPIGREILEFFHACGLLVLEGYGMTESCAAATLNTEDARRFGTVGRPLPGTEVGVAPDGELLLAGPHVFAGYFRDAAATRQTLVDGRLRTGDLGHVDEDGFVLVTGRKKDIIITSSGKNVTPSNIENELKESRWISEAVVVGDRRPYLVALVWLDSDEVPKLAERLGVDPDPLTMSSDPAVRAEIQSAVDDANRHFARIEQVKRFAIVPEELSQAGGELTPTLKVKRNVVHERHAELIDWIYESGETRS